MRILIIEDDQQLCDYVSKGLSQEGHTIEHCLDGKSGFIEASSESFDVIILDRMLPKMSGIEVLKALKSLGNTTPILMLSNLAEVDHKVEGLKIGCDDYLAKPFSFAELSARVEVLGRRNKKEGFKNHLSVENLTLDLLSRKAMRDTQIIKLLSREFKLLEYLMRHEGQIVTKTMLLEQVWNLHFDPNTNVVEVHISRLRQKIDKDSDNPLIHTIRGAGYVLCSPQRLN